MNKLFRVGMSFAIVLVAYWAYALVVVPVISPSLDPNDRQRVEQQIIETAGDRARLKSQELAALFPSDSWVVTSRPMVLESDQAKLLVGDYKPLPDGRVSLKPCTIIFFPKKDLQDVPLAEREPIILEAPGEAVLQFDGSFDLSRGKFGKSKIIGGHVKGPVIIRGKGKLGDASDDLWVRTRNIRFSQEWITTDEEVSFRYGKHNGVGRRMEMELKQEDEDRSGKKGQGPRIAGLKSFRLRELKHLRIFVPEEDKKQKVADASTPKAEPKLTQVDVKCSSGFRLNVPEHRAAFQDDVVISRFRTDGPADQLFCDELVIHFIPKEKPGKPKKKKSEVGIADLEPSWLEARGTKQRARIRSVMDKVKASARELQYHLSDKRIVLQDKSGRETVCLNQVDNTFTAKKITYTPSRDPKRQLGQLFAEGPGVVTARLNEKTNDRFVATWQKELELKPHGKNQAISLTGGAELDYGPTGKLSADTIYFYVKEKPPEPGEVASADPEKMKVRLQPDKMQADGKVKIESKQLSGNVDQCQFWFKMVQGPPIGYSAQPVPVTYGPGGVPAATGPRVGSPPARTSVGTPLAGSPGTSSPSGMDPSQDKKQHFKILGRLLQANVLIREYPMPNGKKKRDTEVTDLEIFDNVVLTETQTDKPNVQKIVVKGDRIHVIDATLPSASVSVFGRTAEFIGRGLGLEGKTINLNRGTNELWVDGPGSMQLPPMKRDLRGKTLDQAEPVFIKWQRGMRFDGQMIKFEEQVFAETKNQKLYTEQLVAMLTEKIDFAKEKKIASKQPDLLWLTCHGGVRINGSTFDKLGRLESSESGEMNYLKIDNASGKVYGKGPGYVRTVRRDKDGAMKRQIGMPGMAAARPRPAYGNPQGQPAGDPKDPNKLIYVKIRFQGYIDGDIKGRLMAFNDQVRGTFGQVVDWRQKLPEDDPDALGEKGALLRCRRLQFVQMPSPMGGDPNTEMEATGNVSIEGKQFTARGHRASYSRQKGLLILEGDGRTNATLYQQKKAGAVPDVTPAKKIMYWPELNRVDVSGVQTMQYHANPGR